MAPSSWQGERARLANAVRNNRPAVAEDARRNMVAGRLEEYISKTLASAPELNSEQRERLCSLFRGSSNTGDAVA